LDADRRTGQINLPAGVRCVYGRTPLTASNVASLARVTGDRELALTALVVRARERERSSAGSPSLVLDTERRIIAARFRGSGAAYRRALAEAGATRSIARGIVGDELRRADVLDELDITRPTSSDVARFRTTFAPVLARLVVVSPAPSWLPEGEGLAIATSAPDAVFRVGGRRTVTIRTTEGLFRVRALEHAAALGTVPLSEARRAIVRELTRERRADAYSEWTIREQKRAGSRLSCERDRMPELGVVVLSSFAPFLALHEASATTPAIAASG
jgi:hypothetical protein